MTAPAFRGASTHNLDEKSRLIVPKRFLDADPEVETRFVLTASPDGCLLLLDPGSFEELSGQIGGGLLDRSAGNRGLRRLLLGHAEDVVPDKAGRILIPEVMRQFMKLRGKEVVVSGAGGWIEIWAPDLWYSALERAVSGSLQHETKVEPVAG